MPGFIVHQRVLLVMSFDLLMTILIFAVAGLYAAVGHAGASGYLAVMGLFGVDPAIMKPTALVLNILVSIIGTYKFYRAGHFSWKLFWPFALTSIPMAFLGGRLNLSFDVYNLIVGVILVFSSLRLFVTARSAGEQNITSPKIWVALIAGSVIGFLSGLTGVGGGIFLSPLLLLLNWAGAKPTAAVSAAFILVNSISGLLGHWTSVTVLPPQILIWGATVLVGGWIGAELGSKRLANPVYRQLLAIVLVVASIKMILTVLG